MNPDSPNLPNRQPATLLRAPQYNLPPQRHGHYRTTRCRPVRMYPPADGHDETWPSESPENTRQITAKNALKNRKIRTQNGHKLRRKGLAQPVENNQPPCGIRLPGKPSMISCASAISCLLGRLKPFAPGNTAYCTADFFHPEAAKNCARRPTASIRDNTLCNPKVHRPSREILANYCTANQLQNHHH